MTHSSINDELQVLIIDDQALMRKIIRGLLRDAGIRNVSEAENGRDGLDQLLDFSKKFPDIIICDLHMDEMSGTEFIHKLRRSKKIRDANVPVIVLTGESDGMVLDVTEQVGANAVLQKPVTPTVLHQEIEKAVGYQLA
jgi:two-component system, chemotaxis family, chemotaxis protein CheY